MTPENDKDAPMEHGELPSTTENEGRPISDTAVPPTTAAVRPAFNVDTTRRGSTFHGAMGFSRGLGHGGRGSGGPGRVLSVRGRGGHGNSGPGRGNIGYGRGRGQSNRGRGSTHRGGIQKHPARARPADANKSTHRQDSHVAPSTSGQSHPSQDTIKQFMGGCHVVRDEQGKKVLQEMQQYCNANNLTLNTIPLEDANEVARFQRFQRIRHRSTQQIVRDGQTYSDFLWQEFLMFEGENEQRPPVKPSDDPSTNCILCGSKTHNIEYCLDIPEGRIGGCILCLSTLHLTDECDKMADMTLTEKVRIFVDGRANLPPLRAKVPWWDLLYTWLNDDSSKGETLPERFPWSKEFTSERARDQHGRYIRRLQAEFDASCHDRGVLPKDVTTLTLDAVYVNHVAKDGATWVTDFAKKVLGQSGI
ncbi:hypothetical protein FGADI_12489 [Fusarium gaditjirri]|uniref:Uncharacterized protein n=1 Tax=Fusarium gaditjirri TaxID=282569 RepID=A0A8H4SSL8_9HYPO|nr:hypothetical protein FGADI_12489 [Fusarium gaditjirri]